MNILLRKFCVICLKIRCELGVELLGTTGRLISSGGGTGSVKVNFRFYSDFLCVCLFHTHEHIHRVSLCFETFTRTFVLYIPQVLVTDTVCAILFLYSML